MTWHAYLVRTMTGHVGRRITSSAGAGGAWSIMLNGIEEASITVHASALERLGRDWWTPWKAAVLLTHDGPRGEVPMILGPLVKPVDQVGEKVTLTVRGIGSILDRRVVLDGDFVREGDRPTAADMDALAKSRVSLRGRALGTIARDVVELSTDGKAAGRLPIRYGTPREQRAGLNERNYEVHNLANNGTWKRLTELAEVINGPDFMFRPAWADETHTMVEWVMVHGTAAQPTIGQDDRRVVLDATVAKPVIADVAVTLDAGETTNRVYWTGAGEGAGVLIRAAQDLTAFGDGMPLLETVGSTSDSDNPALVQAHADAALARGLTTAVQYTGTVDLGDRRTAPGSWYVGDAAELILAGRVDVPNGRRSVRIIAAKGSLGSDQVTLELEHEGGPENGAA